MLYGLVPGEVQREVDSHSVVVLLACEGRRGIIIPTAVVLCRRGIATCWRVAVGVIVWTWRVTRITAGAAAMCANGTGLVAMASAGASAPTPRTVGVAAPSVRLEWNAFSASVVTTDAWVYHSFIMHQCMCLGRMNWGMHSINVRITQVTTTTCGLIARTWLYIHRASFHKSDVKRSWAPLNCCLWWISRNTWCPYICRRNFASVSFGSRLGSACIVRWYIGVFHVVWLLQYDASLFTNPMPIEGFSVQ